MKKYCIDVEMNNTRIQLTRHYTKTFKYRKNQKDTHERDIDLYICNLLYQNINLKLYECRHDINPPHLRYYNHVYEG